MLNSHAHHLDDLLLHLDYIGERPKDILWVMPEGIWLQEGSYTKNKLCDIIAMYYSFDVSCIEFKSSRKHRGYAIRQLTSSEEFIKNYFQHNIITKKIAYYTKKGYTFEIV